MAISNDIMIPFIGIEFDPSGAFEGPSTLPFQALIMGHQLSTSSADEEVPLLVTNADDAAKQFGIGSNLHMLCKRWFSRNTFTPVYCIVVPDPAGTTSKYILGASGTASENGEYMVYLDGYRVSVPVLAGEDEDTVFAKLGAKIDETTSEHGFSVESSEPNNLILEIQYTGVLGNDHDVRNTYYQKDKYPAGTGVIDVQYLVGTGAADVTGSIAGIVNKWFNIIVCPFNDDTNLGLLETEMERRFGPEVQQDGIAYIGYNDTAANTITFATNSLRNSQSITVVDAYKYTQHYMYVSTLVASEVAKSVSGDVGRPLHRITISNLLPPIEIDRHEPSTLNTLTKNGVCTLNPNSFGGPQTFGMVTMYLKNDAGISDIAYQYQTTMFILMFMRYDVVAQLSTKYGRARLADNAERIREGIQVITPNIAKAELIAIAEDWETLGLAENIDEFKETISVQRNTQNSNRLDFLIKPDLVNQFIVGAGINQFKLQ